MGNNQITVAGASGDLGQRIVKSLIKRKAKVVAIVRRGAANEKMERLRQLGAQVSEVDFAKQAELAAACQGSTCVVSALSGLQDVIVDGQNVLLKGAIEAGVPRFIPSDFSIDFTKLRLGSNRNLDLRREFHERLKDSPIAATTIFNGAFSELLTGKAPFILFGLKKVLYWQEADLPLDFTSIDDVAAFTACVALDNSSPRFLHIAGQRLSTRDITKIVSEVTGQKFRLTRAGSLKTLGFLIKLVRFLNPGKNEVFPPWQGMQYMHNMYSGLASMSPLDNSRYPELIWTTIQDTLNRARQSKK